MFTHFEKRFHELSGKTWGIIGLGNIGRRVADIAKAFGCRVIYYSTSGKNSQQGYERVEFDALLEQSDIVSVHAPLDKNTRGLMNREAFREMKSSAVFLNLGRGPIVVEQDLADALEAGEIAGAGLDVLSAEPMRKDNPLRKIKDSEKLIITPHIGWASVEARTRLMEIICQQIAVPKSDYIIIICLLYNRKKLFYSSQGRPLRNERLPYADRKRADFFLRETRVLQMRVLDQTLMINFFSLIIKLWKRSRGRFLCPWMNPDAVVQIQRIFYKTIIIAGNHRR